VSYQHLFRSGGGDVSPASPLCPRLCYRQDLPEQWILVYKISSAEKPISLTKVTATTGRVNQWKLVVNPLPRQQKLAKCYPRTITSSHPSEITVKYQQKAHDGYLMDNHDRKCMWQEMRQRNMNWSSEGWSTNINKP